MQAQVILTGYDKPKINQSLKAIKNLIGSLGLETIDNDTIIKDRAKLWGCDESKVIRTFVSIQGSKEELEKILYHKINDGIYLELLAK